LWGQGKYIAGTVACVRVSPFYLGHNILRWVFIVRNSHYVSYTEIWVHFSIRMLIKTSIGFFVPDEIRCPPSRIQKV